ncbi:MAG TPA: ROK family protein [Dissulfurispiraceae bacterium]|nr:ROK family protein [Dissulfurispiraceae bacterium]
MGKRYCIAGDVGGTNIRISLVDSEFRIVSKVKEPTGTEPLEVLFRLIDSLCANAHEEPPACGIGLAVAGVVDSSGTILRSPNIRALSGFALRKEVRKRYGMSAVIENDANAAAYGEKIAGAGADFGNFVMLTLGTGIGGGIVVNGRMLPVAAEIGHMTINSSGPKCGCGNFGCVESYASATAIIGSAVSAIEKGASSILRDSFQGNFYKISSEDIYNAALDGDALARSVLREAGKALGTGIANMINIMGPEAVILTGGLLGAWNIYIDAAIAEASKRAFPELFAKVKIIPSALGDDAGTLGMAALVFEQGGWWTA